ncbi:MAG: hypothetical protein V1814_02420 [Candidatus Moraniibacteriota bacterium]
MGVKDLFSNHTKYISRKRTRGDYRYDPSFREIMRDPAIAKVLDRPDEQKKFHDLLREKAKDGKVDVHDMKKIAYELAHGKVEDISSTEGRSIARAFFPESSRRYEHDESETIKSTDEDRTKTTKNSASQTMKVTPAFFASRAKSARTSSNSEKKENKKTSFFDAMQSVRRNK